MTAQQTPKILRKSPKTDNTQELGFDLRALGDQWGKEMMVNLNHNVMVEHEADQLKAQQVQAAKP